MPRDMRGTGRYPPQPRFPPFAFYSAVRLGDPELLDKITTVDPYFITQDNGAGAPLHFAITYRQLDMAHHLLNSGAIVNQADSRGWTPLHRAAHLAHLNGYLELYEYLLSRGADPSLLTEDTDPYLNPGRKSATDLAADDPDLRQQLQALNDRYKDVPKGPVPHADVGDWWALYDYGLEEVASWPPEYEPPYPEVQKRRRDKEAARQLKAQKRAAAAAALAQLAAQGFAQPFIPGTMAASSTSSAATASFLTGQFTPSASTSTAAVSEPAAVVPTGPAPSLPVALLFPGQGSQALGMISDEAAALPAVSTMLAEATEVLGYDLLQLIKEGPKVKLDDTVYSQPALFVANLAALEVLRARDPKLVADARAMAGLSLGEYSALVAAGAMTFKEGLKVVKVRGEAMAAAAAAGRPHGMLSIVGLTDSDIQQLCREVLEQLQERPDTVCQLANYLFPQGRVVSGHVEALDLLSTAAANAGALKVQRLAVSGAFHTLLMAPARAALAQVLASVDIQPPAVSVISNVTAAPFPSNAEGIRGLLCRQLVEPVRWEGTLSGLLSTAPDAQPWQGCSRLFEVGPGHQIKAMVRRISQQAWKDFTNVSAADAV